MAVTTWSGFNHPHHAVSYSTVRQDWMTLDYSTGPCPSHGDTFTLLEYDMQLYSAVAVLIGISSPNLLATSSWVPPHVNPETVGNLELVLLRVFP